MQGYLHQTVDNEREPYNWLLIYLSKKQGINTLVWGKDHLNHSHYNPVNKPIKWTTTRKLAIFTSAKTHIMLVCKLHLTTANNFILSNPHHFCNPSLMELSDSKITIHKMKINHLDCLWKHEYRVNKFF